MRILRMGMSANCNDLVRLWLVSPSSIPWTGAERITTNILLSLWLLSATAFNGNLTTYHSHLL